MPSQPITQYQFQKLLEETRKEKNKFVAERDCLMYEIAYYLGFRPMEVRCIKISHINFEERTLFIPAENNKERHEDNFPIPELLFEKLWNYIENNNTKSIWLFPCYWNKDRKQDVPVDAKTHQRNFTNRMKKLNFIHRSFIDGQNKPRYNFNLYSFRKRFGTFVYKKTRCPKTTALLLRQYDPQLKSVWRYIFAVQKEERKNLMQSLYKNA